MLFENLLNAVLLMEVIDGYLQSRVRRKEYLLLIATAPFEIPEA